MRRLDLIIISEQKWKNAVFLTGVQQLRQVVPSVSYGRITIELISIRFTLTEKFNFPSEKVIY